MTEIRAFVGHSFTDDDHVVVRTFLTYFDQLSDSNLNFSWQHAEAAEPKVLADKVMSLLADKNVFIGICTKKERVIPDNSLTKAFFVQVFVRHKKRSFTGKLRIGSFRKLGSQREKSSI